MKKPSILHKEEVYQIVGSAIEVLNVLGHGLLEKNYENALCVEFALKNIHFVQQPKYKVTYKGRHIGDYVPDLVAFDKVIVETKAIERIGDNERGQILNYLKITGLRVGLLLNFKHPQLEWERLVL